jgi:hypothetical protein
MLIECYPSKKHYSSPPMVIGTPHQFPADWKFQDYAKKHSIDVKEVRRRNDIIHHKFMECKVMKGQVVYPKDKSEINKYGSLTIRGVCRNIFDFGATDWPKDDNPMIVSARPEKQSYEIICTVDYFNQHTSNNGGTC